MIATATQNPWRVIEWTGTRPYIQVDEIVFHESELEQIINLPFPQGAVVREPICEFTTFMRRRPVKFFKRHYCPFKAVDQFTDWVNQGDRDCMVVDVHQDTGWYLYDYIMPAGKKFFREALGLGSGRPVSPKHPPAKWREFFEGHVE